MEMETYNLSTLAQMLNEMSDYLNENPNDGYEKDFEGILFEMLWNTGLFHDACGKPIAYMENEVVVSIDY